MTIGSRKMTPPRMLRIVPFGERYMRLRSNSSTRASSGVIVAHFTPTPNSLMAFAASTVIWSSVSSRFSMPRSKYFRSTSRYGRISFSLMKDQMTRVISSPSSSTMGFFTWILAMRRAMLSMRNPGGARGAVCHHDLTHGTPRQPPAGPPVRHPRRRRLLVAAGPVPGHLLLPGQLPLDGPGVDHPDLPGRRPGGLPVLRLDHPARDGPRPRRAPRGHRGGGHRPVPLRRADAHALGAAVGRGGVPRRRRRTARHAPRDRHRDRR